MKEITISEKNFKRFAKRYQKLNNVSLMDAQEQLSQVLGCSNYHELNQNFQQNKYSYQQYNNFLFEIKSYIDIYRDLHHIYYFDFRDANIKYVSHQLHFMEIHFYDEKNTTSLFLDKSNFNQNKFDDGIKNILNKYLLDKDSEQWLKGFIDFLNSLPKSINIPGVFILHVPKKYIDGNKVVISLERYEQIDKQINGDDSLDTFYDLDYFSGDISNLCEKRYNSSDEGFDYVEHLIAKQQGFWSESDLSDYQSTSDEDLTLIEHYDGDLDIDDINNSEVV